MTFVLDRPTVTATQDLTATLHYLKRGNERPVRYVEAPPAGVPQWNGIDDPREIRIEDAPARASRRGSCTTTTP